MKSAKEKIHFFLTSWIQCLTSCLDLPSCLDQRKEKKTFVDPSNFTLILIKLASHDAIKLLINTQYKKNKVTQGCYEQVANSRWFPDLQVPDVKRLLVDVHCVGTRGQTAYSGQVATVAPHGLNNKDPSLGAAGRLFDAVTRLDHKQTVQSLQNVWSFNSFRIKTDDMSLLNVLWWWAAV